MSNLKMRTQSFVHYQFGPLEHCGENGLASPVKFFNGSRIVGQGQSRGWNLHSGWKRMVKSLIKNMFTLAISLSRPRWVYFLPGGSPEGAAIVKFAVFQTKVRKWTNNVRLQYLLLLNSWHEVNQKSSQAFVLEAFSMSLTMILFWNKARELL